MNARSIRWLSPIIVPVMLFLGVIGIWRTNYLLDPDQVVMTEEEYLSQQNIPNHVKEPSFLEVAKKYNTDKVTTHQYHHLYQKYLGPIRREKLKMLEIGLGCGMPWGAGASLLTWSEWLPSVELYYIEFDATCAAEWQKRAPNVTIFTGDQASVEFLQRFLKETGGNFDVIIDDGGHQVHQQIASLDNLYKSVKPGGLYFLEDLRTSYLLPTPNITTLHYIKEMLDDLIEVRFAASKRFPLVRDIFSMECMVDMCVFVKMKDADRVGWPGYH